MPDVALDRVLDRTSFLWALLDCVKCGKPMRKATVVVTRRIAFDETTGVYRETPDSGRVRVYCGYCAAYQSEDVDRRVARELLAYKGLA